MDICQRREAHNVLSHVYSLSGPAFYLGERGGALLYCHVSVCVFVCMFQVLVCLCETYKAKILFQILVVKGGEYENRTVTKKPWRLCLPSHRCGRSLVRKFIPQVVRYSRPSSLSLDL